MRELYARLDLDRMQDNAARLLSDHGRSPDCPFLTAREKDLILGDTCAAFYGIAKAGA